jgi:molecular chaperone DnaJ
MAKQDYYEALGVARGANGDEIKKAYRKLAMRYHPDRNPGDAASEARFKEINQAYDVLKDEQKRAAYDRYGHAAFDGSAGARPGGFDFATGFADIFDEMFGDFMGGGARRGRTGGTRGSDLRYNLEISLEEAFAGKQATIRVPTSVVCEACGGAGAEAGTKPTACGTCNGAGRVRSQQGFFTIERTCPTCGGAGRVIKTPCKACGGAGRTRQERSLNVTIPAGVEDGTRMRLAGEGEAGLRGAPPGDLYIFLSVKPHRIFQRDGADIFCRVPIPMVTAALGGAVEVPIIDGGRDKVTIPEGSQSGAQFRLRGKGMSMLRSQARGDMYVQIQTETPVNLTRRQRELLEEFARESGEEVSSPESHGFFHRVKEFLEEHLDLGKE